MALKFSALICKARAAYLRWRLQCLWSDIHAAHDEIILRRAQRSIWIEEAGDLAERVLQLDTESAL